MTDQLTDHAARARIREDLDTTLVVEAAAGTGKTSELVRRMIAVLKSGRAQLDQMIAVTFTDAAAGELKLRLRTAIEEARQEPDCPAAVSERLKQALSQLEEARVGTIHSFCADMLRERPVEAGVDPLFETAPNDVSMMLFERAFDRWFEAQLANPGEGVRRVLRHRVSRRGPRSFARDDGPRGKLRAAALALAERRDFPARWRVPEGFHREAEIDAVMEELESLGRWADSGDPEDFFIKSLAEVKRFIAEQYRREAIRGRDYDGLEAELITFLKRWHSEWIGYRRLSDDYPKADLIERRKAVKRRLTAFKDAAGADLAPRLRDELWIVIEAYEHLKARGGYMDFLDLLLRARDLVRDNSDVRRELQRRFTHIYVDEFQDTDPLQAEILMLLAADDPAETDWRRVRPVPGKLFTVGDPKQSIYRFRRADVALYEAVKQQVIAAGGAMAELNVSFRATPAIQQAVNSAFAPLMCGDSSSQARYVPLARFRAGPDGQPSVVALPVPAPYGDYRRIVKWKIEESLPDATAAFVEWLVKSSGWTVTERERPDARVPLQPRHVCLLFRRFRHYLTDVTRPYVRALEARRLPHLLVGGSSFHMREEVEAIRNCLAAIERPEDELAVFATLRGPFFALGDGVLLAYRERCGSLHPFKRPPDDLPEPLREVTVALAIVRDLHRGRNRRPLADTIGRLLAATRAHAALAIWPTGEQALANVSRLMDLARRGERNGLISFRAFLDWLIDQAERGEAGDAPIIEEGTEGVRIMTVHRAKGLEFPVVILADMTARDAPTEPARWVDTTTGLCAMRLAGCTPAELLEHGEDELRLEREEAARIVYVAATRARDLLVVPAVGDERQDGWLQALNRVVYPSVETARRPHTTQPPGCPQFGEDSVPRRPVDVPQTRNTVIPGLHIPEAGDHTVVWWDPSALNLYAQETVGLTQQKLLMADESGVRSREGIRAHEEWQKMRMQVREQAGTPSIKVLTATERALDKAAVAPAGIEVRVEQVPSERSRPHGVRFGTLVHAVLSVVDLDSDEAVVRAAADLQGRLIGASMEEIEASTETVVRALAHPLLRRASEAMRAGRCRRESPVSMQLQDGLIVEGIIDLAFLGTDGDRQWTVIDFKTDVEIAGRLDEYVKQVAIYVKTISLASGLPARGVLLRM